MHECTKSAAGVDRRTGDELRWTPMFVHHHARHHHHRGHGPAEQRVI